MKLQRIFALEFGYQLHRPATWLYFGVIGTIAFLIVTANYLSDAQEGYFKVNAPVVIATVAVLCSVFWLLIGASVAGDAAARDVQTRMHLLTYTAATRKADYLGGRLLAALALNVLVLLAVPAGLLLAMHASGIEPELLGPFRGAPYLTAFFFIVLPNAFIATAIQFSVAALSRRAMGSYLGGAVLFVAAYVVGQVLQHEGQWGNLVDPMAFTPVMGLMSKWSPLELNARLVLLEDAFLVNRLLWLGIALGSLAFTYFRFQLVLPESRQKRKLAEQSQANGPAQEALSWGAGQPQPRGTFGVATWLQQLRLLTGQAFRQLATSKAGLPLLGLLALVMCVASPGNLKARGVPLLPRTDFVIDYLTAPITQPDKFWIVVGLLTIFYAGELVWRERETGLNEISNAAPVPEWVQFLSRYLALVLVLVSWLAFLLVAGMGVQVAMGGFRPELWLYVQVLFGLHLLDCLLFPLLALAVHVLVNQKFVGHLVALLLYGCLCFAPKLGIEHKLLIYAASPGWTYSDLAGFGPSVAPWLWFKSYWAAWALLLGVVAVLFWVRSRDAGVISRFQLARRRFRGAVAGVAAGAAVGILGLGGYIFYNTNVRHAYTNSAAAAAQRAAYEQRFRRYQSMPQPLLTGVTLGVEMYPKLGTVQIQGTYLLVNNNRVPIDSVLLAAGTADVATSAVAFSLPAKAVLVDEELGQRLYALSKPLAPGDSLRLRFEVAHKAVGFSNDGADAQITANASSFRNLEWLPTIGYQPYRELDEAGARKAYGLPPRPATASLYDVAARQYAPFPEQIRFEATVGTDADQTVVAPGTLRRSWTKAGRRYFHYASEAPIRNEYAFFSARYALHEGKWHNPTAGGQDVAIQVYYPRGLTENPARMVRSAQASLDYYTRQFGPYPHRQLRFVAHSSNDFGNHAAPINITTEEGFFLLNPKADERGFDLVTAVVAHEIAHQWWGNQLKQAYVEGAGLITESLAWYSAMGVLEDKYGAEHLQALLGFLREENETPRTRAAKPLLQADDWYQNYRKGPLALYALSQYIGRDRVNGALRQLLAKHRPGTLPRPTSLDLYHELQAATPDSVKPLLRDLFQVNTFWELAAESARAQKIKTGAWQLTFTVKANKLAVDSLGAETKLPMKEWVEIGVFAPAEAGKEVGKPLYRQKYLIASGKQTIVVTVPDQPAKVGIDPRNLLVDWKLTDNYAVVQAKE
ncbi:ABC transporter permease/M1 family aminopeptidase [Hymenobacter properus]|uniref:ABC transporter permease n=1 Tax=Hymenobacter properus TaxID=2791026 RepID=A0A931BGU8_9BACT|nr:M1 family aminopeptidase [Hymenobacter properus]MBF9141022.1 ABC transporter permease [Hymenobacter properus]MBR7719831.1 hypothetical protein [Microvirga sp. SRT04]